MVKTTRSSVMFVAMSMLALLITSASGQNLLFHGGGVDPDSGADGAIFDFLVEKLGEDNVVYLQGAEAAWDGSSANDFQAVIISMD